MALSILAGAMAYAAPPCSKPGPEVTRIAKKVLDTRLQARREGPTSPARQKLGEQLSALAKDSSKPADEALVLLLNYYLGESFDEDLLCLVVRRGQRVLPFLTAYQKTAPCPLGDRFQSILLEAEVARMNLTEMIGAIEKGEKPPCD